MEEREGGRDGGERESKGARWELECHQAIKIQHSNQLLTLMRKPAQINLDTFADGRYLTVNTL